MSSFFREMMPDNLAELTLFGGIGLLGYKSMDYYKKKNKSTAELEKQFQEILKQTDANFKEKESALLKKLEANCLSDDALTFLRNIKE